VSAYVGAVALSPAGERLGDVVAVRENTLQLAAGGLRNVLGFIDFSDGAPRHVPAGDILFGERRTVGHTMVIVVSAPRH
jgi:hypothetical protein